MGLTVQNGSLVVRDGALGTGQGCCCNKCSGPCDGENPCPEGCVCVDGQCVAATGACCINGACDPTYTTQEACEACETVITCTEYLFLEDQEQPCPEGWQGGGGFCQRTTNPASCEECAGECSSSQSGPCGDWLLTNDCNASADCSEIESVTVSGWPERVEGSGPIAFDGGDRYTVEALIGSMSFPMIATGVPGSPFSHSRVLAAYSLSIECGRWRLSMTSSTSSPDVAVNWTFSGFGPLVSGCNPYGSYEGTFYWTAPSLSGSLTLSMTIGE